MNRKELAAALKISGAMVTKLAKRGMPTDRGVEAAQRWRSRHLEPARTKGLRAGTAPAKGSGHVSTPMLPATSIAALRRVQDLAWLAYDAIAGKSFAVVAPMLRQALQAVPVDARAQVAMPLEVWDALTAAVPGGGGGGPNDFSEEFMGTFWYQIALGDLTDHSIAHPSPSIEARNAPIGGRG